MTFPPVEDLNQPLVNKIWLQGTILTGVFYGIVVTLCCNCLSSLASPKPRVLGPSTWSQRLCLRLYVILLFTLSTGVMVLFCRESEVAYLEHSQAPATYVLNDHSFLIVAQSVCYGVLHWASDGLLVWRCITISSLDPARKIPKKLILTILVIMDITVTVALVIGMIHPMESTVTPRVLLLTYGFYTLAVNACITLVIVVRLLERHRQFKGMFGHHCPSQIGGGFLGIISVLVESAAVIVVYDLFFLIPTALGHPLSLIGRHIGIMVQIIPPLMIIHRVTQGVSWSELTPTDDSRWTPGLVSQPGFTYPNSAKSVIEDAPSSQSYHIAQSIS